MLQKLSPEQRSVIGALQLTRFVPSLPRPPYTASEAGPAPFSQLGSDGDPLLVSKVGAEGSNP